MFKYQLLQFGKAYMSQTCAILEISFDMPSPHALLHTGCPKLLESYLTPQQCGPRDHAHGKFRTMLRGRLRVAAYHNERRDIMKLALAMPRAQWIHVSGCYAMVYAIEPSPT